MAKVRLTPDVQNLVCAFIRAGGFPHVAAAAAGVPPEVFDDWLERGKNKCSAPYRRFRAAVEQACAQARLRAEKAVLEGETFAGPLAWLRYGPGKEQPGRPGWTSPRKPEAGTRTQINILQTHAGMELVQQMLGLLAPFPEARQAVAAALAGTPPPKQVAALPHPEVVVPDEASA